MNFYNIEYQKEVTECTKPFNISFNEKYYDVNNKICFSLNVFKSTFTLNNVKAGSIKILKETFGKDCKVELVKTEDNLFDKLITEKFLKFSKDESIEINKEFIKTIDKPCSDEVQEKYRKSGYDISKMNYNYLEDNYYL